MIAKSLDQEIAQWLRQADHDLEMAEKNISLEGFDTSVLLSQQAVEKYLKATFLKKIQKRAPKTHFLDEIAKELSLPESLQASVNSLTSDYTASRYPDVLGVAPVDAYEEEDALDRLQKAKDIIAWCKGQLK